MQHVPRQLFLICTFVLSLGVTNAQLVPGKLPDGPPPQPGQVTPDKKKSAPAASPSDQNAKPSTFEPEKADIRVSTQTVLVPTSVLDPDGHGYVNGLQASDFEVLDNN